jgi:hypothetical protein
MADDSRTEAVSKVLRTPRAKTTRRKTPRSARLPEKAYKVPINRFAIVHSRQKNYTSLFCRNLRNRQDSVAFV